MHNAISVTDATLRPVTTNPFRYGALALDEAFTDRETEVEELLTDVLNGQDVVVFAPRAMASPRSCGGSRSRRSPRTCSSPTSTS